MTPSPSRTKAEPANVSSVPFAGPAESAGPGPTCGFDGAVARCPRLLDQAERHLAGDYVVRELPTPPLDSGWLWPSVVPASTVLA